MLEEKETYQEQESKEAAEYLDKEAEEEKALEENLDEAMEGYSLAKVSSDLIPNIINAPDKKSLQNELELFNLNQSKKNALRVMKLNSLLDEVEDQAIKRFKEKPDMVSNKDLLDYMQVVAGQIERSQKYLDQINETPAIQIKNQKNEVNVNISSTLDRDSKEKVIEAVKALLKEAQSAKSESEGCITDSDVIEASSVIVDEKINTTEGETND